MNILIVEDDIKINQFLQRGFKEAGYHTLTETDGKAALDTINSTPSLDLIILDLMLPSISGIDILRKIRTDGNTVPVIILSAKKTVDDKISGLQIGADDYLEKPFSISELVAQTQALFRRNMPGKIPQTQITYREITLNLLSRKVTRGEQVIDLQPKELSLLEFFLKNPDRVLTKTMILENVYGYNFDTQTNVVDVLVCRLRNKIEKNFDGKVIHTLRGLGYVLRKDEK